MGHKQLRWLICIFDTLRFRHRGHFAQRLRLMLGELMLALRIVDVKPEQRMKVTGLAGARAILAVLVSIAVAILLTECSANPVNRAVARTFYMDSIRFPTDMTTKVIYAAGAIDEIPVSLLGRLDRSVAAMEMGF